MGVLDYHYLGQDVLKGFDSYRYSCQDTSPLSKYVMHPFWNLVVKLCPQWVAPNLLTFVGFLCCIGHYAVSKINNASATCSL
jgi:ethanolaminephosphotransferase